MIRLSRRDLLKASAATAWTFASTRVHAAAPAPTLVTPALIEAAREEGKLVWYAAMDLPVSERVARGFEAKYPGIAVRVERSGAERIFQRIAQEQGSGIKAVDVANSTDPAHYLDWKKNGWLAPYIPDDVAKHLPADQIDADGMYATSCAWTEAIGYNTNLIKPEDAPKSYADLLDPKWKGKLGIEAGDAEWMATIVKQWGDGPGMAFFRKLSEMRPEVRKGHVLLAQLVAAGEIPVGLTIYSSNAETLKRKGAPIDWAPIDLAVARPQGIAVVRNAPHPAAAALYSDFVISAQDGQKLYEEMGRPPVSTKIKSHLTSFPYVVLDPVTVLDESEKWGKLWEELFLKR
jgi:iron(III) transport system substrate-binding protein